MFQGAHIPNESVRWASIITLQDGCWSVMLAQRLRKVPDQSMEHPIREFTKYFDADAWFSWSWRRILHF